MSRKFINDTLTRIQKVSTAFTLSTRPLPSAPDGLEDYQAAAPSLGKKAEHGAVYEIVDDILGALRRGPLIVSDRHALESFIDAIINGKTVGLDDRLLVLENVLVALSRLEKDTPLSDKVQDAVIQLLYGDLPHPAPTMMGKKYAYRSADGSGNNVNLPDMGKAGTPYSRSVQSINPIPYSSLPDPSLIFEGLLKRDVPRAHPSGISSLMFAFANIIIHSLFKTDGKNRNINNTSSYLDLSPLYGDSEAEQAKVRVVDGRGLLKPDTFSDKRLSMMPLATPALLVLFSRNHNYIATKILQINERRQYVDPSTITDKDKLKEQDDDVFNKARLVNCGHFMNIILSDYLGAILGLTKDGSDWTLNPLEPIREIVGHSFAERGEGNVVSVEFNLLYRWHATTSVPDEEWLKEMMKARFPGINMDEITSEEFKKLMMANSADSKQATPDGPGPETFTFGDLKRGHDGKFDDDKLADIIHKATNTVANSFGARGTPEVMRAIEMMAIEEARGWGVATLNEFRRFMGLRAYETFEEWNKDPVVAGAARSLYGHVDFLELYPGMQAEQIKEPGPGAGLCPGYTISRAILGDAVALTRGDRFLTTDFTPFNLTAWGYQDCARDVTNGAFGGQLSKILLRNLPHHYEYNSVMGLFPFYTPDRMVTIMQNLDSQKGLELYKRYNYTTPIHHPHPESVNSWSAVDMILKDTKTFKNTYEDNMAALTHGHGFVLSYDDTERHDADLNLMRNALFPDKDALARVGEFYQGKTTELINTRSFALSGKNTRSVNIVRDVINLVPVHWVSTEVAGIPLKTKDRPHGLHTEPEVYGFLAVVFTYIFLNVEPTTGWILRENAEKVAETIQHYVRGHLESFSTKRWSRTLSRSLTFKKFKDAAVHKLTDQSDESHRFLKRLAETGRSSEELAYMVFGIAVSAGANFAHAAALVVNFYLEEQRTKEREEIIELVKLDTPESDAKLAGYVREALRIDPQAPGLFRDVVEDTEIIEKEGPKTVHKGQRLFVSLANANMDPTVFPDPKKIDPTRPRDKYLTFGSGMHTCMGNHFTEAMIPQVLRSIFSLKNVRRGPGDSGRLNRFKQDLHGTQQYLYVNAKGHAGPWPASMVLLYDVDVESK